MTSNLYSDDVFPNSHECLEHALPQAEFKQVVAYQIVLNHHDLISHTTIPAVVRQEASTHKKLIRLDGQRIVYQQHAFKQQQDQSISILSPTSPSGCIESPVRNRLGVLQTESGRAVRKRAWNEPKMCSFSAISYILYQISLTSNIAQYCNKTNHIGSLYNGLSLYTARLYKSTPIVWRYTDCGNSGRCELAQRITARP